MRSRSALVVLFALCLVGAWAADEQAPAAEVPVNDGFTTEQREAAEKGAEKHEFQAEVTRLMDILINSLYGNREIFLRELISNAADACDKIRFESLTNKAVLGEGDAAELDIRIQYDKEGRTLTLTDKGIGMTKQGLIKYLGVVASTGTTEFLAKAQGASSESALSLIGQFGVGFYSVYLVADKVTVVSKHNDDDQYIWQSKADKTFTVVKDPRGNTLPRGTSVTLHLKEDASEFLNEDTLKKIVMKYSEFINFPIYLLQTREEEREVPDEEAQKAADEAKAAREAAAAEAKADGDKAEGEDKKDDAEKKEGDEELDVSEEDASKKEKAADDDKPKTKKVKETVSEWKQVNSVKAIWTRDSSDITEDEYNGFYKTLTKDEKGKLNHIHFKAEGEISFKSILYIPKKAPDGYYDRFYEKSNALKLYVRRVLISEEFDDFMPRYLSFVKGVVDSDDLPLNVNREALAQNRVLKVMGKKLTRKALDMLKKMADKSAKLKAKHEEEAKEKAEKKDEEAAEKTEDEKKEEEEEKKEREMYDTFWREFGKSIKLGVIDDRANKAALAKLLRYQSSKSGDGLVGLAEYVSNMPEKQDKIYYITGANLDAVRDSPMLERLKKKGYEVLFMVDPLDEYVVQQLPDFDGKKLQSATKDLPLDSKEKKSVERLEEANKETIKWFKDHFGAKIEKVVVSSKLTSSPCVVSTGQYGYSANMERIMKAQTFADPNGKEHMTAKKTLEINPYHPIIKEMAARIAKDPQDKALADLANTMLDSALLVSGFALDNPTDLSARLQRVLANGLGVDPDAQAEEAPEEPEEEEEKPADAEADSTDAAPADDGAAAADADAGAAEDLAKNLASEKDEL